MKKSLVIFRARPNYRITDRDARVIGKRLMELGGPEQQLTTRQVFEDARKRSSPLHRYFDWDVRRAAERYWLSRAGYLLRAVAIEVRIEGGTVVQRCFHSVRVLTLAEDGEPAIERRYVPTTTIRRAPTLVDQLLSDALRDFHSVARRYREYADLSVAHKKVYAKLAPVFGLLDELERDLDKRTRRKK